MGTPVFCALDQEANRHTLEPTAEAIEILKIDGVPLLVAYLHELSTIRDQ